MKYFLLIAGYDHSQGTLSSHIMFVQWWSFTRNLFIIWFYMILYVICYICYLFIYICYLFIWFFNCLILFYSKNVRIAHASLWPYAILNRVFFHNVSINWRNCIILNHSLSHCPSNSSSYFPSYSPSNFLGNSLSHSQAIPWAFHIAVPQAIPWVILQAIPQAILQVIPQAIPWANQWKFLGWNLLG